MPAYAVGFLNVHNPSWQVEYRSKLPAVIAKHGGRLLAAGGAQEPLEGMPPAADSVVIFKFPSMDHARAWYADVEHAPLVALRQTGATLDMVLIQGKED